MLKHPRITVGLVLLLTLFFGIAAVSIIIDNDLMIFFPEDNPSFLRKEALEDNYGSQIMMDICITTEEETLIKWENLDMIEDLTRGIGKLTFVQDVTSMTNTDYPAGTDEGMSVSILVPEGEERTPENLRALKERLLDWPDAYARTLYSDDFQSTQILVSIDQECHSDDIGVLLDQVRELIKPYDKYPLTFRIAGDPVVTQIGKQYMYADLMYLIPLVAVVLFLCLFLSFKRISSALLPLATVMIATVWTVGTMALFGVTFTIISSCLPVLIIAVGSAYGIHVINHYYHVRAENRQAGTAENIRTAMKEVFLPILLAGVTTLIGFLSILTSPILPMKAFGVFAGVGTVYSLLLSYFFIPVLLEYTENRKKKAEGDLTGDEEYSHSPALLRIAALPVKHRKASTAVILVLAGFSFWGLTRINVESSLIGYFPYKEQIRRDSRFIDEHFGGTNIFSVVYAAEEGYDLTDPAVLKNMDDLKQFLLRNYPDTVGQIISYSDFIKRMNQIMNYPAVEEASGNGGDFDDEPVADDSFFASDSFFGDDASAGMDSFFGGDTMAAEEPAGDSSVTATFRPLSEKMTLEDLILLLNDSFTAGDDRELTMGEISEKIKELTNYRGAAYYEIPWDVEKYPVSDRGELKDLISQYLLLYSGSLDDYANDSLRPTEARMMIQLKTHGSAETDMIIKEINAFSERNLPEGYSISCAGIAELELALTNLILSSQMTSILFALVAVFLIIAFTYKSPLAGLIGIVPLSLSILMNFGLMSLLGINLDMVTAIIASIAIGIGVDYTVHFLSRYKKERALTDDLVQVTRNTVLSTGRGIIINALSVGLGFAVLCFSRFLVLRYIGILVAIIMATSSMGALIILPLILNRLDPSFMRRDGEGKSAKRKTA